MRRIELDRRKSSAIPWGLVALCLSSCQASIGDAPGPTGNDADAGTDIVDDGPGVSDGGTPIFDGGGQDTPPVVNPLTEATGLGFSGTLRLTREEYAQTIKALVDVDVTERVVLLPEDPTPFDNNYQDQTPSQKLIEASFSLAKEIADTLLSDPVRRDQLVGCQPSNAFDEACLRSFVTTFGRRALRRPLQSEEVEELVTLGINALAEEPTPAPEGDQCDSTAQCRALFGPTANDCLGSQTETSVCICGAAPCETARGLNDFYAGVGLVVRSLLMDTAFLYRVELGDTADGEARRLTGWELASRLSFFLWGTGPDDDLLDAVANGQLATPAAIRAKALEMMSDARAARRMAHFHAQWFGYAALDDQDRGLPGSMRRESDALVVRTVIENRGDWFEIFRAKESFIDAPLAEIYGLPAPPEASWVQYGDAPRQGLLSHSSFLASSSPGDTTSPVKRGQYVRERIFCRPVPPPPPEANADDPPVSENPNACKPERYAAHSAQTDCAGCHALLDPVGFGLERYDTQGAYRIHEEERPDCPVSGEGAMNDLGLSFNGPAELSDIAMSSGLLGECLAEHLLRFTTGRHIASTDRDLLRSIEQRFESNGHRLHEILLDIVSSEAFRHRVIDTREM